MQESHSQNPSGTEEGPGDIDDEVWGNTRGEEDNDQEASPPQVQVKPTMTPTTKPSASARIDGRQVKGSTDIVDVIQRRGVALKRIGSELVGLCPFHKDSHPSLSVNAEKKLWTCRACGKGGSQIDFVMLSDGLSFNDALMRIAEESVGHAPPRRPPMVVERTATRTPPLLPTAIYRYTNAAGTVVGIKKRFEPAGSRKLFTWSHPDGSSGQPDAAKGLVYNLPAVVDAIRTGRTVLVVEGEKCVDKLTSVGLVATTNPDGAGGGWKPAHSEHLRGADVVVLPDNDEVGRRHAANIVRLLEGKAKSVRVCELPGLPEKGDVVDFLEQHTPEELTAALLPPQPELPEPMPLARIPPAPRIPLELLPDVVRAFVEAEAEMKAVEPEMVAIPALVALAGAIGKDARVNVGNGWEERACLWGLVIAPPGSTKSAAQEAAIRPLRAAEKKRGERLRDVFSAWQTASKRAFAVERGWERAIEAATKEGKAPPERPAEAEQPTKPPTHRIVASNGTAMKLAEMMFEGSRGLTLVLDELSDFLENMSRGNQQGTDKPFFLNTHVGTPIPIDRLGRGEVPVDDPYLSIIGGIQPKKAKELLRAGDDGLFERFGLMAYPTETPTWRPRKPQGSRALDAYARVIDDLVATDWDRDRPIQLSPGAAELFATFDERLGQARCRGEWPEEQAGFYGKATGLVARLVLVCHLTELSLIHI